MLMHMLSASSTTGAAIPVFGTWRGSFVAVVGRERMGRVLLLRVFFRTLDFELKAIFLLDLMFFSTVVMLYSAGDEVSSL